MEIIYKVLIVAAVFIGVVLFMSYVQIVLDSAPIRERLMIHNIEKAMGFRMNEYQKDYILHGKKMPDGKPGQTTAKIIRTLTICCEQDILIVDLNDVWNFSDKNIRYGESWELYCRNYLQKMKRIWHRLLTHGVPVSNLVVRKWI